MHRSLSRSVLGALLTFSWLSSSSAARADTIYGDLCQDAMQHSDPQRISWYVYGPHCFVYDGGKPVWDYASFNAQIYDDGTANVMLRIRKAAPIYATAKGTCNGVLVCQGWFYPNLDSGTVPSSTGIVSLDMKGDADELTTYWPIDFVPEALDVACDCR